DWCRVVSPHANELPTKGNLEEVIAREKTAIAQIKRHFADNPDDIAAIIIEPIQAEGGDNHFRPEFLQALRDLADENEALLIFDEVQTGVGLTGTFWMHEQTSVKPDILVFGKKMQVCGILAGDRVREVPENVFEKHSRINSTWGGSLVDMVRSEKALEVIEQKNLLQNVRQMGSLLMKEIRELADTFDEVENPRGLGLMCAFDLPSTEIREKFRHLCYDNGLLILGCGTRTVRFRTALTLDENGISEGMGLIRHTLSQLFDK
ncbi:MAG TPA: aminotransferase class III-fold pyridoxal phosphate-dependent enzyme, partial [Rhodothermales bacterium]|nr:aminotransferase class III-fold pyridoxal phosphate-dependent enzyme [Rhodothermales bacterium]